MPTTRALGVRPYDVTLASLANNKAQAPSFTPLALPGQGSQIVCTHAAERAAVAAKGGADGVANTGVCHGKSIKK
jgi:hypothetical protein